jgi:hypothetical protein
MGKLTKQELKQVVRAAIWRLREQGNNTLATKLAEVYNNG